MKFPTGHLDLYLTDISEPIDNQLRVVVWQASLGEETIIDETDFNIEDVRPMEVGNKSRIFELFWPNYVAYAVRNESFWDREDNEPDFEGHLYRRFESAFFRYVSATTFANDDYPGPLEHWALATLNHCLDVIGVGPPEIRLLNPAEAGRRPTTINFKKV